VRRGRKRFRTNDLFIPARPNGVGGCGGDDDGDDDDDDGDDDSVCVCVCMCRQDKENPYRPPTATLPTLNRHRWMLLIRGMLLLLTDPVVI